MTFDMECKLSFLLCNSVLKCVEKEHLQVKLTMTVGPERPNGINVTSSQTSVYFDSAFRKQERH